MKGAKAPGACRLEYRVMGTQAGRIGSYFIRPGPGRATDRQVEQHMQHGMLQSNRAMLIAAICLLLVARWGLSAPK